MYKLCFNNKVVNPGIHANFRLFSTKNKPVLIVGAGPSGLVTALWLSKRGIPFRIIDKNEKSGETTRATGLHARTLEFYRQLGISDDVFAKCLHANRISMLRNKREVSSFPVVDGGKGFSPFPKIINFFPQDVHEAMLVNFLEKEGVKIDRKTELTNFTQNENEVVATLKTEKGTEIFEAAYLCGCDGAHSTVRNILNIGFPGGTYSSIFFVVDVIVKDGGTPDAVQICITSSDFCMVLPLSSNRTYRVLGVLPKELEKKQKVDLQDIHSIVTDNTNLNIEKISWFSTYHSHHRVADHFQKGRAFLLGDAGHIHSPAGGQGMNTGIGDAVNLAWKLAAVLKGQVDPNILQTYETERISFARLLVSRTDKVFQVASSRSMLGRFFKKYLIPLYVPLAVKGKNISKYVFFAISQIHIKYHQSLLSSGQVGKIHGGNRLPWVEFGSAGGDNFLSLKTLEWQVHVYGEATEKLQLILKKYNLPLKTYPWTQEVEKAGLSKDAFYLIRPDGYIGLVASIQDTVQLEQYISKFKLSLC